VLAVLVEQLVVEPAGSSGSEPVGDRPAQAVAPDPREPTATRGMRGSE
jgi:hypothetical protein